MARTPKEKASAPSKGKSGGGKTASAAGAAISNHKKPAKGTGDQPSTALKEKSQNVEDRLAALEAMLEAQKAETEKERVARLKAEKRLGAHKEGNTEQPGSGIIPIPRPKGEAGDGKFKLQEVMRLDASDKAAEYKGILRSVRHFAIRANIDLSSTFKRQEAAKLANVYKQVRDAHPYMARERFPADWATAEMLKQYLRNYRKQATRNSRGNKNKRTPAGTSSDNEPEEDEHDEDGDEEHPQLQDLDVQMGTAAGEDDGASE